MRDKDYEFCREVYEKVYRKELKYDTVLHEDIYHNMFYQLQDLKIELMIVEKVVRLRD